MAPLIMAGSGTAALSASLHPLAGAVLAVTIAWVAARAHRRLRRPDTGSDPRVAQLLQSLPNDYFLLNDVILPDHGGGIDHVVIGPCGVVVIGTKNPTNALPSHWNAWFVNGRRCRRISTQINGAATALRAALAGAHPDLKDSALRAVDSVVVFSNPRARLKVDRAQTTVARHSQLLDVVLAKARRNKVPASIAARLASTLASISSREGDSRLQGASLLRRRVS
jgi:Nuclease-related domain